MTNTFFWSDPHLSHWGVCKFLRADGVTKLRPWDNPDDMDNALVENFNKKVGPNDVVYCLGDVAINRRGLKVLERLNNRNMRLIYGNHDIFHAEDYLKYFKRLHGSIKIDKFWLTHIPVHPSSIPKWCQCLIHGHIHSNEVMRMDEYKNEVIDSRYLNISVEMIDYTPISLEEMRIKISERQKKFPL